MPYIVYIIAGLLAGVLTGLVGLSAAIIIAPAFATFLGMDPYVAIGIALASDVFASGVGSVNYLKERSFNLKKASFLTLVVVLFAIIASYISYYVDTVALSSSINIVVLILGFRFLLFPVRNSKQVLSIREDKKIIVPTLLIGAVIGFISGFFGSGGGLSILALLTIFLRFDVKKAVGTSLFIMTFTALVGAGTHIVIAGTLLIPLIITSVAAVVGSYVASKFGNKIDEKLLSRIIGIFLLIDGIALLLVYYL